MSETPKSHQERALRAWEVTAQATTHMETVRVAPGVWASPFVAIARLTYPAELVEALKTYVGMCPDCGGSGVRRCQDGDPEQCQWCYEAHAALALYDPPGDGDAEAT